MGFIGGGGSVLLPTLIYLLDKESTLATAYTLVLVGVTALFGMFPRIRTNQVDFRTAITLGIPILIGTLLVRGYLTHLIPDHEFDAAGHETNIPLVLFQLGAFSVTKRMLVLLVFASVLLVSFMSMIGLIGRNIKPRPDYRKESPASYYGMLIGSGIFIGVLSAFIGARRRSHDRAFARRRDGFGDQNGCWHFVEQLWLASQSLVPGDVFNIGEKIEWGFLGTFAFIMVAGVILGSYLVRFVSGQKLKKGFAWFILAMAIFIFTKELLIGA